MRILKKLISKIKASLFVFKKAEIMQNIVRKEIDGEYDNLCHTCFFNERYHMRAALGENIEEEFHKLRISLYLGGALGDYIVYLRFVDEISSICQCSVDLFLDRIAFGGFVFGSRENVKIIHDAENCLFINSTNSYDLAIHLDHGITLKHCNLGSIREKAPAFYETACKIVEHAKRSQVDISKQHERESVILRQAKFFGETKWSKLSCSGAIHMEGMYSNIILKENFFPVLSRYQLYGKKYITVNYGADKNMGGTAQTKVLPFNTLNQFILKFKSTHPDYLIVQTGVPGSLKLDGADRYAFDCRLEETAFILKNSLCHVDSEGGLVHLASQMSTPCVVSFGPTPSYYYGYPRNKNIVSEACKECMSVTPNWSTVCPRKLQVPECMQAISENMILKQVDRVLEEYKEWEAPITHVKEIYEACMEELEKAQVGVLAWIGTLDFESMKTVRQLIKQGWEVSMYIGTHLNSQIIQYREELKKMGIKVEYGSVLNIAQRNNSFDFVVVEEPDFETVIPQEIWEKECARIVKETGKVLLFTPSTV